MTTILLEIARAIFAKQTELSVAAKQIGQHYNREFNDTKQTRLGKGPCGHEDQDQDGSAEDNHHEGDVWFTLDKGSRAGVH